MSRMPSRRHPPKGSIEAMSIDAADAAIIPLLTDDDVLERARSIVGTAVKRTLWVFLLDDENVQLPVLLPIDDYPGTPYGGNAERIAAGLAEVMEATPAVQVVFVWERHRAEATTEDERVWARELSLACAAADVRVRAQLISHARGVRWFPPDDFV